MYLNIFAEMARKKIDKVKMAKLMHITPALFESKLSKQKTFTVNDVFKMQKIFAEYYCTFDYLLKEKRANKGVL